MNWPANLQSFFLPLPLPPLPCDARACPWDFHGAPAARVAGSMPCHRCQKYGEKYEQSSAEEYYGPDSDGEYPCYYATCPDCDRKQQKANAKDGELKQLRTRVAELEASLKRATKAPPVKKQKTDTADKNVFLVIHDGEPQDTGSNHNYSDTLPNTQDTKIIGVFTSYSKAVLAAEDYAQSMDWLEEEEEEEEEEVELDKEMWRQQLEDIDWCSDGFSRDDSSNCNTPDDRLHIMKRELDVSTFET